MKNNSTASAVEIPAAIEGSLPMITVRIPPGRAQHVKDNFDTFTRCDVKNEFILDAVAFGEDEAAELSKTIGFDAEELQGSFILFFCE